MLAGLLDRTLAVVAVIEDETITDVPCEWMVKKAAEIRKFIQDGKTATEYVKQLYPYNPSGPREKFEFIDNVGTQYSMIEQAFVSATAPKSYSAADKALLRVLINEVKTTLQTTADTADIHFRFLKKLGWLTETLEKRAS